MCVGVDVGGLNLENVRWHGAVRLNAHVLVNDGRRETLAVGLRSADAAAAETCKSCEKLCNVGSHRGFEKEGKKEKKKNSGGRLLTSPRSWCKAAHRGFWDSIGSLRNSSSTFDHLDSHGSQFHTHLCLGISGGAERENGKC